VEVRTYKTGEKIENLLGRYKFLDKVKVRKRRTLFEFDPDFNLVKKGLCGVCGRKLKLLQNGKGAHCDRKRCPATPKFYITIEALNKLRSTLK
jgi:hypothetical protein